jgi:hypothetical protein
MNKTPPYPVQRVAAVCLLIVIAVGCSDGPLTGRVEGTVTVDGQPTVGLKVFFYPPRGRMSRTITDENGYYRLQFKPDVAGALVGKHKVVISTVTERARQERLPARYNSETKLTADVKSGKNVIDFPLESK